MRGTGDIDGQRLTDPVIDLLSELAEVVTRRVPPTGPATSTDTVAAGPD